MREELKKLPFVPKNKEDICREIQRLWDQVDPRGFPYYTEQFTCKIEDVIEVHGLITTN